MRVGVQGVPALQLESGECVARDAIVVRIERGEHLVHLGEFCRLFVSPFLNLSREC